MAAAPVANSRCTYLHLGDGGTVWFEDGTAIHSGQTPEDFIRHPPFELELVRLMGTPRNASLVQALCDARQEGWEGSIQVCSPKACETAAQRRDPVLVFLDLPSYGHFAASLGGWHEVDEEEAHTYRLAAEVERPDASDCSIAALAQEHPLWSSLSFLDPVDPVSVGRVLARLIDPRWYVDPDRPNRTARFLATLGLFPAVQLAVARGDREVRRYEQCLLTQCCWDTGAAPVEPLSPGAFCWGARLAHKGPPHVSILKGSQTFALFLRHVWLHHLGRSSGLELFVPEWFFKSARVARAFRRHVGPRF